MQIDTPGSGSGLSSGKVPHRHKPAGCKDAVVMDRATAFITFLDEVHRLRGRMHSALGNSYGHMGLTNTEIVVLNAVVGAATPPTVPRIGRSLGHARQVIQRAANALIERGLIEQTPNPDHKRAHRLVPTALGREAKREADRRGLEAAWQITEGLEAEYIDGARQALREIRKTLEANMRGHEGQG